MAVIRQPRSQLNQTVQRLLAMLMSDKQMKKEYSQRSDLSEQAFGQNMKLEGARAENDAALAELRHRYRLNEEQVKALEKLKNSSHFKVMAYLRNDIWSDPNSTQEEKDFIDKKLYAMANDYGPHIYKILKGEGDPSDHAFMAENFGENFLGTVVNQGGASMRDSTRREKVDIPGLENKKRELDIQAEKEKRLLGEAGGKGKVTQAEIVKDAIKSMESRGLVNKNSTAAKLPDSYKDPAAYGKVMSTLSGLLNKLQKDPNSLTDEEMQWISDFAMTSGEANKSGFRAPGEKPATAMDNISGLVEKIKAILGQVGGAIGGGASQAPQSQGGAEDTATIQGKQYRVGDTRVAKNGITYIYRGKRIWDPVK